MIKFKRLSKILAILCVGLTILSLTISCGKKSDSAQSDDISINSPIVYSGGWGGRQVTIQISSDLNTQKQENPAYQDFLPQIQNAIDTWNAAIGHTVLVLNTNPYLSETGNNLSGCEGVSNRLYFPLCYSFKGIFYDKVTQSDAHKPQAEWTSGWAYNTGKDSSILATTVWNASGDVITSADIRYNRDSYVFGDTTLDANLYEDPTLKIIVDLQSVTLHELGHVLGLGHTPNEPESVMYPTMNIGPDSSNPSYESGVASTKRTLSTCDINRVQHVYSGVALKAECNISH